MPFCDEQGCTSAGEGAPGMAYMPNSWCESTRRQIKKVHRIQTEGQHQQGKGIVNNGGSERLLRGRTMYVANSKPAIWHWGEGRADLSRRIPISGQSKEGVIVRTNAELDGIWGGSMPYLSVALTALA